MPRDQEAADQNVPGGRTELSESPVRLVMGHPDLLRCPRFELPPGWAIRWWEGGDEALWLHLQRLAEPRIPIQMAHFERAYGSDEAGRGRRICFLLNPGGDAVGTASAWYDGDPGAPVEGRVHWVAVAPAFQGRGLAKPLLSVVCTRMAELGHARACLHTDSGRLPAISLYAKFGFRPRVLSPSELPVWRQVRARLGFPAAWESVSLTDH